MVIFFLTVIVAGLMGTPIAERNFATLLTWNIWWAGLIFSIFFLGSAWCAICPWDDIAQWLVRRRLWKRAEPNNSLNLRVPKYLNNVWPALIMFIGLTWLELGLGITTNPYATALVALLMVVLATVSLAVFKRKAFCQHFCPVGRTIGFYSQLSAIELRPIEPQTCADCKTLDCYHGNDEIEPCPTSLMMGSLKQNSYCTSCGNCTQSCPQDNIAWRLRTPNIEATQGARPRWDEAWFMIGLLALTGFHGLTMMSFWEDWMGSLARAIGDSGQLLWSFTIGLMVSLLIVVLFYALMVSATRFLSRTALDFKGSISTFAFVALPIAFSYHMAHNLNHLIRESSGVFAVIMNPLGTDTLPLSMGEKHQRHMEMWMSQDALFAVQSLLMIVGFVMAVQIIKHRSKALFSEMNTGEASVFGLQIFPILIFAFGMTSFHLWMLLQPMIMRM
jgi:ferredoxin